MGAHYERAAFRFHDAVDGLVDRCLFKQHCMQWTDALPIVTLGYELGTATRNVKNIVHNVFIKSVPKEVDECRGRGGVGTWVNAPLLSNNSSQSNTSSNSAYSYVPVRLLVHDTTRPSLYS